MTASIPTAYGLKAVPPPTGRGMHGRASLTSKATRLVAHGTSSKMRSYFYPSERLSLERPNTIELVRCKMSDHAFSHKQAEPVTTQDCWLKPRGSPPHRLDSSPAACGGLVSVKEQQQAVLGPKRLHQISTGAAR